MVSLNIKNAIYILIIKNFCVKNDNMNMVLVTS